MPEQDQNKKVRLIEDLFILVSIVSLWPVVLGWQGLVYEIMLYAALAGLVYIFFRRMRRFREARDDMDV
jgi:membrane protein implicated in regulation of membrane protease activity